KGLATGIYFSGGRSVVEHVYDGIAVAESWGFR
ncbi:MAG: hypothetical protein JWN57_2586, partial [Frankiales bacterium]|nr:hypothetical protein [Frankiales bacterium]